MKGDLNPAKRILTQFLRGLAKVEKMVAGIKDPIPATSFTIEDRIPILDGDSDFLTRSDSRAEEEAYIRLYLEPWHPKISYAKTESQTYF